jgi:hypothetical protein
MLGAVAGQMQMQVLVAMQVRVAMQPRLAQPPVPEHDGAMRQRTEETAVV